MKQEKIEKPLHETFLQIVTEFGENILNESRLLGLLSDLGGREFNQYKFVVKCLLEKNIGNQILDMKDLDDSDRMLRIANLQQTIVEEYSLQEEKVKYIIDCYLYSLGFIKKVNAEDGDMLENVESNDTESSSNKKPFKPDPFIFEELLALFRKHSKIAAGNGRVSKRKEMSSLKVNVTTFTQAVETKYGVTLDTPSFSSFLTVENLLDYIIEKYELKSVEHQTELSSDRELESSWDKKTPQTPVSYIKIEDPSLVNLPVFTEILTILRNMACCNINESTRVDEWGIFIDDDWYGGLPEKIQSVYGVRPNLPAKKRFETIGDLIKYIIQKTEIRKKLPLPMWAKFAYISPAPLLLAIIGKVWLIGETKYNQIILKLNDTKRTQFKIRGEIKDAANDEVTWILYLVFFLCIAIGLYYHKLVEDDYHFENSLMGYFLKFGIMMLLVHITMQWWPALLVALIELVIRYCRYNNTEGECTRNFVNKFAK